MVDPGAKQSWFNFYIFATRRQFMSFAATGQLNMSQIFIFCDIFFWKSSEKGSERRAGKAESVEKAQFTDNE